MSFRYHIGRFLLLGKRAFFLRDLLKDAAILDVGCGNNSSFHVKKILPHSVYTGIDVGDYNQTKPNLADHYIVTTSENFASEIAKFQNAFDAVISSHNIEHCGEQQETFMAMLGAVKPDGRIYLSFPSEQSVSFPAGREGCLNYFDDSTHKGAPPCFDDFINLLKKNNFQIEFSARNYQPAFLWLVGLVIEPYSAYRKKVFRGTWEYYGFESIIVAKKVGAFLG